MITNQEKDMTKKTTKTMEGMKAIEEIDIEMTNIQAGKKKKTIRNFDII
jgi:hypothetical protein